MVDLFLVRALSAIQLEKQQGYIRINTCINKFIYISSERRDHKLRLNRPDTRTWKSSLTCCGRATVLPPDICYMHPPWFWNKPSVIIEPAPLYRWKSVESYAQLGPVASTVSTLVYFTTSDGNQLRMIENEAESRSGRDATHTRARVPVSTPARRRTRHQQMVPEFSKMQL